VVHSDKHLQTLAAETTQGVERSGPLGFLTEMGEVMKVTFEVTCNKLPEEKFTETVTLRSASEFAASYSRYARWIQGELARRLTKAHPQGDQPTHSPAEAKTSSGPWVTTEGWKDAEPQTAGDG
jgi:hypothetical protein